MHSQASCVLLGRWANKPQDVQIDICVVLRCAQAEPPGDQAARAGTAVVTALATSDGGWGTPRGLAPHTRAAGSIIMLSL